MILPSATAKASKQSGGGSEEDSAKAITAFILPQIIRMLPEAVAASPLLARREHHALEHCNYTLW